MKLIILLLFATISLTIPSVYAWNFGDFVYGDTMIYDVCDYTTLDPYTAVSSKCYELSLVVLDKVDMDNGYLWLVHVTFDGKKDILLIDESFKVKSIYHKYIATSLSNTIFWMNNHIGIKSFDYTIGSIASTIPSRYHNVDVIVSDFIEYDNYTEYMLSWFVTDENQILVRDDVPLPVEAVVFSEIHAGHDIPYAFTFNLVDFRPNLHGVTLPFDVTASDVIPYDTPYDVMTDITPLDVIANYTSNIPYTTHNNTRHFDDILENISNDISDDIYNDTIIENSTISISSMSEILIPEDVPSVVESKIILNDIPVQSIKEDDLLQNSEQKPEESFLDMLFSFFSSLIGIR